MLLPLPAVVCAPLPQPHALACWSRLPAAHRLPLRAPTLSPPQVLYPVAPEVYRDVLWEDVDVADPAEYTFCRYTPVTTEVRLGHGGGMG